MLLFSEYYKIPDLLGDAGSTPGRMIVTQTIFRKDGFTSMITNFDQNQSILHILFAYVDSLTIGGVPPITGRPPICRKALLKCFS